MPLCEQYLYADRALCPREATYEVYGRQFGDRFFWRLLCDEHHRSGSVIRGEVQRPPRDRTDSRQSADRRVGSTTVRRKTTQRRPYHSLTETEADFQRAVLKAADGAGWYRHHDSNTQVRYPLSDPGFLDLVLARDGRIIFAELKKDAKAHLTPEQEIWVEHLGGLNIGEGPREGSPEVYVWRPDDWDQIVRILA